MHEMIESSDGEDTTANDNGRTDDSDDDDIIDDIVGIRRAARPEPLLSVASLADSLHLMELSTLQPATPTLLLPRRPLQTSTPAPGRGDRASPALRAPQVRAVQESCKASDVFDISDSFMMDVDLSVDAAGPEAAAPDPAAEDSFDQFAVATQETPLAERIRRRLNR